MSRSCPNEKDFTGRPGHRGRGRRAPRVQGCRSTAASSSTRQANRSPARRHQGRAWMRCAGSALSPGPAHVKNGDFAEIDLEGEDRRRRRGGAPSSISCSEVGSGRALRGHRRGTRLDLGAGENHHLRVEPHGRRPRGRDRLAHGHPRGAVKAAGTSPRPTATSRRSPARSTRSPSSKGRHQGADRPLQGLPAGRTGARDQGGGCADQVRRHPGSAAAPSRTRCTVTSRTRASLEDDVHRARRSPSRARKTFQLRTSEGRDRRGREDQGQPGRAHPLPRAGTPPGAGWQPGEFIQVLDKNGQIQPPIAESPATRPSRPCSRRRTSSTARASRSTSPRFTSRACSVRGGGHRERRRPRSHDNDDHEGHNHYTGSALTTSRSSEKTTFPSAIEDRLPPLRARRLRGPFDGPRILVVLPLHRAWCRQSAACSALRGAHSGRDAGWSSRPRRARDALLPLLARRAATAGCRRRVAEHLLAAGAHRGHSSS